MCQVSCHIFTHLCKFAGVVQVFGEKSCEIKSGGHEMAAMMLMIIMHKAIIKIFLTTN